MSEEMLELLLADPQFRPAEGWSARAEVWTEERMTASWYTSNRLAKVERRANRLESELKSERQEVADLTAEVEALRASLCPDVLQRSFATASFWDHVRQASQNPRTVRERTQAVPLGFLQILDLFRPSTFRRSQEAGRTQGDIHAQAGRADRWVAGVLGECSVLLRSRCRGRRPHSGPGYHRRGAMPDQQKRRIHLHEGWILRPGYDRKERERGRT